MKLNYHIIILYIFIQTASCFVPAKLIQSVINKVNQFIKFESASQTLTHEEIIKRGIIQSVAKYFYDKSNKSYSRINLNKTNNEYLDLKNLYYDYYGIWFCKINLESLIRNEFQTNVAVVDFDKATKDLPYAHFDAEMFEASNERVIEFTNNIFKQLSNKNYRKARKLTAQILHTIQDFYSHSNWIEMGNNDINYDIGHSSFMKLKFKSVINRNDNLTCNNNCNLTTVECNTFVTLFVKFLKANGLISFNIDCPLKYYVCRDNIMVNDKLLSGYYGEQELSDGSTLDKPFNLVKCSHGGIMDTSSLMDAIGGINKDSGYYM